MMQIPDTEIVARVFLLLVSFLLYKIPMKVTHSLVRKAELIGRPARLSMDLAMFAATLASATLFLINVVTFINGTWP